VKVPIAVLASGRGSNLEAIHAASVAGWLQAEIVAVISDRKDALVLEKARALGLNALYVEPGKEQRISHEKKILAALSSGTRPHFLVLAGYMRILSPLLIEAYRSEQGYSRIVNVHPSLLPAFPGVGSYAQAFQYGAKLSGVTVHLVESEVDNGPICAQESFSLNDCTTEAEVEQKGLAVEHRLYPETLGWVLPEKFKVDMNQGSSGRLRVRAN
jgi:phosphoribosylglycinamide formyltransferase-1